VDHLEGVALFAVFAVVRLKDAATLDELLLGETALDALEGRFLHLRDDVAVADHDALDGHELVDVGGVEVSDPVLYAHVEGTHLDDRVVGAIVLLESL
jgi:hypothetical protein